jgi:hypothetical protein
LLPLLQEKYGDRTKKIKSSQMREKIIATVNAMRSVMLTLPQKRKITDARGEGAHHHRETKVKGVPYHRPL